MTNIIWLWEKQWFLMTFFNIYVWVHVSFSVLLYFSFCTILEFEEYFIFLQLVYYDIIFIYIIMITQFFRYEIQFKKQVITLDFLFMALKSSELRNILRSTGWKFMLTEVNIKCKPKSLKRSAIFNGLTLKRSALPNYLYGDKFK